MSNIQSDLKIRLARNIKYLRKVYRETQEDLANHLNKTKNLISSYEKGASYPPIEMIKAMANHYGVSIDDMCYLDLEDLGYPKEPLEVRSEEERVENLLLEKHNIQEVKKMKKEGLKSVHNNQNITHFGNSNIEFEMIKIRAEAAEQQLAGIMPLLQSQNTENHALKQLVETLKSSNSDLKRKLAECMEGRERQGLGQR